MTKKTYNLTCTVSEDNLGAVVECLAGAVSDLEIKTKADTKTQPQRGRKALGNNQTVVSVTADHFAGRVVSRDHVKQFVMRQGFAADTAKAVPSRLIKAGRAEGHGIDHLMFYGGVDNAEEE